MADDTDHDENRLMAERRAKLARLRGEREAFPNDFRRDALAGELVAAYASHAAETLQSEHVSVRVAGRLVAKRLMGKSAFAELQDGSGRIQLFLQRGALGEALYDDFKKWDVGDIVGATGELMKTKTGELSIAVQELRLLVKSLRPLPEKWHGIADQEIRLRQRYLDLIVNERTREVFRARTEIVKAVRRFLDALDFLEVYQAYAGFEEAMTLTETLVRECTRAILGKTTIAYQGKTFDVGPPFPRVTLENTLRALCTRHGIETHAAHGAGKLALDLFEKVVEPTLDGPVFVTHYPAEVSPLARKNDADPFLTDRFELFIGGREFANGFSELNDPEDQAARFHAQIAAKERGDEEAMFFDADYIRALEHAMPPAAGMGLGIDRLTMLLTDSASIRDVLLFPQLKRE